MDIKEILKLVNEAETTYNKADLARSDTLFVLLQELKPGALFHLKTDQTDNYAIVTTINIETIDELHKCLENSCFDRYLVMLACGIREGRVVFDELEVSPERFATKYSGWEYIGQVNADALSTIKVHINGLKSFLKGHIETL